MDAIDYDTYGWAEGYLADDPQAVNDAPFVDRAKWLSDSKSMQVWSDRYSGSPESRDETPGIYSPASPNQTLGVSKITEIQVCWFNVSLSIQPHYCVLSIDEICFYHLSAESGCVSGSVMTAGIGRGKAMRRGKTYVACWNSLSWSSSVCCCLLPGVGCVEWNHSTRW